MSVLIRGMEMPTNCCDCGMKVNCDECEGWEVICVPLHHPIGYYDDLLTDKRRDDCPLVPVPPHGDLIDRDAILKAYGLSTSKVDCSGCKYKNEVRCEKYELCEALNDAPTIIEAEEGE